MDVAIKLSRKFNTYVPRKKQRGAPIDWEALAKSRNFFNNSAHEMFKKLYADTEEDFKSGKMSINKLAPYLGVSIPSLTKALKEYGFHVSPRLEKVKYNNKNREKYSYPYIKLGFQTEREMWIYFIENKITSKRIVEKIYDSTGKSFLRKIVNRHIYLERRSYKKEKQRVNEQKEKEIC